MLPETEHKVVEHMMLTRTLLMEIVEDNDGDPTFVSRELSAIKKCNELLEEIKHGKQTGEPKPEAAATDTGVNRT